jgi:hypothetical protein
MGKRTSIASARTPEAVEAVKDAATWSDVVTYAEHEDGGFRVDESVRRDPELFLAWLRKNEPTSVYPDDVAEIHARNRVSLEIIHKIRSADAKTKWTARDALAYLKTGVLPGT